MIIVFVLSLGQSNQFCFQPSTEQTHFVHLSHTDCSITPGLEMTDTASGTEAGCCWQEGSDEFQGEVQTKVKQKRKSQG
jgi:hypothetical protein